MPELARHDHELLLAHIREIADWPEPGVGFKDITPLLAAPDAFATAIRLLAGSGVEGVTTVAGIEARGFILGAPVAHHLGVGFVPIRKAGKLPGETNDATYQLEYGEATIEVHRDAFAPGARVLVVDDVLATGGTVRAAVDLIRSCGAEVVAVDVLMELTFLGARAALSDVPVRSLLSY